MANEIQAQLSFRASKGGATVSFQDSFRANMGDDNMVQQTQLVGTTAEVLDVGDIALNPQFVIIKNLDTANQIEIGGDASFTNFSLIVKPGEFCVFTPNVETIYVKASTSPVRIFTLAVEY